MAKERVSLLAGLLRSTARPFHGLRRGRIGVGPPQALCRGVMGVGRPDGLRRRLWLHGSPPETELHMRGRGSASWSSISRFEQSRAAPIGVVGEVHGVGIVGDQGQLLHTAHVDADVLGWVVAGEAAALE